MDVMSKVQCHCGIFICIAVAEIVKKKKIGLQSNLLLNISRG